MVNKSEPKFVLRSIKKTFGEAEKEEALEYVESEVRRKELNKITSITKTQSGTIEVVFSQYELTE